MLYIVRLPFESVNKVLWCDQANESYWAVLSCCTVASNFWVCGWNPMMWPFKWSYWAMLSFVNVCCTVKGGFNFWVCGWNPMMWPFKWSYWAMLSFVNVCCTVKGGFNFWVCGWNPLMFLLTWNLSDSAFQQFFVLQTKNQIFLSL